MMPLRTSTHWPMSSMTRAVRIPASWASLWSVREGTLREAGMPIELSKSVTLGDRLDDIVALVEERGVDLLVLHTKDAGQMAMHGLAYPLAVELRSTPLLML